MYVPHLLYPFTCQWTLRLLSCPGYCKQYCSEHCGTCLFLNYGFLRVYAQQWDCWVIWQFCFQFFKGTSILFSIVAVSIYIPTNSARGFPLVRGFLMNTDIQMNLPNSESTRVWELLHERAFRLSPANPIILSHTLFLAFTF